MLTDLEIEKVKWYQHARIPEIYKFDHMPLLKKGERCGML